MRPHSIVRGVALGLFGVLALSAGAFGQARTNAALNGTVRDQSGAPLANVAITAVHEPTGSRYQTLTRSDGRFNLPGLRVGGPYTIAASLIGYKEEETQLNRLRLGEDRRVDFVLAATAVELAGIEVVAERGAILSSSRTGAEVNVTTEDLESLPTLARSIQDFARISPLATGTSIGSSENIGGISIAGKNNRFNNIQVDGAIINDAFGLPASGTAGGQANAQPISLDAVQEFNVEVAPFDVRESGFTGGLINAITRSGTNEFEGSAYFYGRNQDFVGQLDGNEIDTFHEWWAGARLGGPLVKDKAFFFFSGERKENGRPLEVGTSDNPAGGVNFDGSQAAINQIIDIAKNTYGYDPGGAGFRSQDTNDTKVFARFDFNLGTNHRLTARYNYVKAISDRGISRSSSTFGLASQGYVFDSKAHSAVLQLNSRFGPTLANEARVSLQLIRDKRDPDFPPFPEVRIDATGGGDNVELGIERFSQANALDQDVWEITDNLTWYKGNHSFTFGTHSEIFNFDNLFIQDFFGQWEFDSIDDFANGTPFRYRFSFSKLPGVDQPRAEWTGIQFGLYAQDSWQVSPKLRLLLGLRADIPVFPDNPLENPAFAAAFPGRSTSDVPSGNVLWSPRFGFNYDATGDRKTQIRGGAGIFSGRNPFVWISNQYSNTGVDLGRIDCASFRGCDVPNFVADPFNQPVAGVGGVASTSEINLTNPDFKFPQAFRSDLALDQELTEGVVGTIEGIYTKNVEDVFWRDINLVREGCSPANPNCASAQRAIDGRPLFSDDVVDAQFTRVLDLGNSTKGYQYSITGQIQKRFGTGRLPNLYGSIAYTFMQARDANSGQSSRAISNWQFNEVVDPNTPVSGRSDFEIRHSIHANVAYRLKYGADKRWATTISLWYNGREGRPYSYVYFGDANNDGATSNDLIFVPDQGQAIFDTSCSSCLSEQAWLDFVRSDSDLADDLGKIASRNGSREPWAHQLDLRVTQDIPTVRGQSLQLFFDWINFASLDQKFVGFQSNTILSFRGYDDATGKPIVRFTQRDSNEDGRVDVEDIFSKDNLLSRWQIQLGARYNFNF